MQYCTVVNHDLPPMLRDQPTGYRESGWRDVLVALADFSSGTISVAVEYSFKKSRALSETTPQSYDQWRF